MSNMTMIKDIPDPAGKPKYMWKKEWVRPHESLWSVMRNFRIVNGQCSYKEALNLLDIGPLTSRKQDFQPDSEYVIYSRYTIKDNWRDNINKMLLPEDYHADMAPLSKLMKYAPRLITRKFFYCPECMKSGYHSYLHQLSGISRCPFHREEELIMDYRQTYIWGEDERFNYDFKDGVYLKRIVTMSVGYELTNEKSLEAGQLPTHWKMSSKLYEEMGSIKIYDEYESLVAASSSSPFINSDISGGRFFIEDARRKPFVAIYDRQSVDLQSWSNLINECDLYGIKTDDIEYNVRYRSDHYRVLENLILYTIARRFIEGMTLDEVRRSEGFLIMGGKILKASSKDAKVMFLWDYIGCKHLHGFLSMRSFDDFNVEDNKYALEKRYCAQNLLSPSFIRKYGLAAAMHILEDHFKFCYFAFFRNLSYELKWNRNGVGMKDELELFQVPTYLTEEKGGQIYIYKEE